MLKVAGILILIVGFLIGVRAAMTHSPAEAGVALLLAVSGIFMAVGEAPPFP
jgi:hypothetical protein